MSDDSPFSTPQEAFWAGAFGTDYIDRNRDAQLLASNLQFFSRALQRAGRIESCAEIGANIGMNLRALKLLYPEIRTFGVEINPDAAAELGKLIGAENVFQGSLFDWQPAAPAQLSYSKGVLIHIQPESLARAYDQLHAAASRYVMVAEYYNRSPVAIPYRGHEDRLFKRDFAGEMLDRFSDLTLIDYGFAYHRDPAFPQDDISWFLMEKGR
jgi:pseudaminic acid biosynthesis-associated methylase